MNFCKHLFRFILLLFFFGIVVSAKTTIDLTLNSEVEIAMDKSYHRSLPKLMIYSCYDFENKQTVPEQFLTAPPIESML